MAVSLRRSEPEVAAQVIPLPRRMPTTLGVGAFLKSTACLVDGSCALVSCEAGDLGTAAAVLCFEEQVERLLGIAAAAPVAVAHDRHPDFHSTRLALDLADRLGIEALAVQHHHAHIAAVMAEHGLEEPVLGLALDGFGMGDDGGSWGGELLFVDAGGYRRLGHLAHLPQPGGDKAAREPWRMGAAALHAVGRGDEIVARFGAFAGAPVIRQMLARGINAPPTSSCGRLFDAACGLLGVKPVARFEGEAPMALEALVSRPRVEVGGWRLDGGCLEMTPLLAALADRTPEEGSDLFHGTLIAALDAWAGWAFEETGLKRVVLAGGCLLNRVLREGLIAKLEARGLVPLLPRRLGPGDAAVSLGQAWAAAMRRG